MTERRERDAAVAAREGDVDRLFRPLAAAVRDAARARGDGPTTAYDRVTILRAVDVALDRVYGRFSGDPDSALLRIVARRCREARAAAVGIQVRRIQQVLPADVRRAVEGG